MKTLIYFLCCFLFLFFSSVTEIKAQQDTSAAADTLSQAFIFDHTMPRLFSVPTGRVLNSLDFSLLAGSSFSFGSTNNFLGTVSLGLGGYGEIELSSASLMGSLFNREESFSYIGMKIKLLGESERLPDLSIGLKTNNEWNNSNLGTDDVSKYSNELFNDGIRSTNYDSRITTAFIAASKTVKTASVHLGISYSDLRIKNVKVTYNYWNSLYVKPEEDIKKMFNLFGGLEFDLNERTKFLIEAQSFPYLKINPADGHIETDKKIVGVVGLRFFVSRWLLVDSGILYQDDYKGIADAQLKLSLNGIWNLKFK